MGNDYERAAEIFRALCDENRIRIIELLRSADNCGNSLLEELDISQPTLSHHMKILGETGIVDARRDGKKIFYSLNGDSIRAARDFLGDIASRPASKCPEWFD